MATHRQPALARHAGRGAFGLVTATCVAIGAALLVGCGSPPDRGAPAGTTVTQDGVAYSVQFSRELNPEAPDDRVVLGGLARRKGLVGRGTTLVGVFVQARNDAAGPRRTFAAPRLVTAFGKTFAPLQLPPADPFAYRGALLEHGREIPGPQTAAAQGPDDGLVLVYRVPTGVFVTDRPFTERFGPDDRAASVQLDI